MHTGFAQIYNHVSSVKGSNSKNRKYQANIRVSFRDSGWRPGRAIRRTWAGAKIENSGSLDTYAIGNGQLAAAASSAVHFSAT